MAASNIVKGTPWEEPGRGNGRTRSRTAAGPAAALSKLKRGGFYGDQPPKSALAKGEDGEVHAKKDALPNASLVGWAKGANWERGGVGTAAAKSQIEGLPKPPVKNAFQLYMNEMLRSVTQDLKKEGELRHAVRKEAKQKWDQMAELDKLKYENTAKKDKERYDNELAQLKRSNPELAKKLKEAEVDAEKRRAAARAARKAAKQADKKRVKERKKHDAELKRKAKAASRKAEREADSSSSSSSDDSDVVGDSATEGDSEDDSDYEGGRVAAPPAAMERASRRICRLVNSDDEEGERGARGVAKKSKGATAQAGSKAARGTSLPSSSKKKSDTVAARKDKAGDKRRRGVPPAAEEEKERAAGDDDSSGSEEGEGVESEELVDPDLFDQLVGVLQTKMAKGKDKVKRGKLKKLKEDDMSLVAAQIAAAINAAQGGGGSDEDEDGSDDGEEAKPEPAPKRARKASNAGAGTSKAAKRSRKPAK